MISQKSTGANGEIRISTNCEICKTVHDREREATSRCLECQKSLCRHCVQAHQTITVTRDHSIYEIEIEKDILCKVRLNIYFSQPTSMITLILASYNGVRSLLL